MEDSALDAHIDNLIFIHERNEAHRPRAAGQGGSTRSQSGIPEIGEFDKNGRRISLPLDAATLRTMIRDLRKRHAASAPYDPYSELGKVWAALRRIGLSPGELPVKKLKADVRFSKDAGDFLDQSHQDFHSGLSEAERLIDEAFPKEQPQLSAIRSILHDPAIDKGIRANLQSEFANHKLPSKYLERFRSELKQLSDEQSKKLDTEFGFLGLTLPDDPAEKIAVLANAAGIRSRDIPDMTVLELYQEIHGYLNRLRMQAAINREHAATSAAPDNSEVKIVKDKQANPKRTRKPKGKPTIKGNEKRHRINVVRSWNEYKTGAEKEPGQTKKQGFCNDYQERFPGITIAQLDIFLSWYRHLPQKTRK